MVESGKPPQAFEPLDLKIYITQNVVFYSRQKGTFSVRHLRVALDLFPFLPTYFLLTLLFKACSKQPQRANSILLLFLMHYCEFSSEVIICEMK